MQFYNNRRERDKVVKDLIIEVQTAENMEYKRAAEKFGAANNSNHESYAIILEEFDEALAECEDVKLQLEGLWEAIKANKPQETINRIAQLVRVRAERAAAEFIQVAAMCYKATVPRACGNEPAEGSRENEH